MHYHAPDYPKQVFPLLIEARLNNAVESMASALPTDFLQFHR